MYGCLSTFFQLVVHLSIDMLTDKLVVVIVDAQSGQKREKTKYYNLKCA